MNRKGEIDKGIIALPVFLAVLVILIVFGLISAGLISSAKLSDRNAVLSSSNLPVVFEKIKVENSSGQFENITFIEGMRKFNLNENMKLGLKEIAPTNGCLYLHYKSVLGINNGKQDLVFFQNKVERKSDWKDDFSLKGFWQYVYSFPSRNYTFSFTEPEEKYFVESYSGRCLDE